MKAVIIFLMIICANNIFAQNEGDTVSTPSGLKYIVISKGSGEKADVNKSVEVHYTGLLTDGKVFDSSVERNQPIEFILGKGQVIKGWDEGILLMSVGDKLRLIIPPELAYGERGAGDVIPPNAVLIFDVELLSVGDAKISIAEAMLETILNSDVNAAIAQYKELKTTSSDKYNFKENELNNLGYQLMKVGKTKDAVEILKLNAEMFPNSANVYDSLGEACMMNGDNKSAKENYEKSLELNPKNDNAAKMLKKLSN